MESVPQIVFCEVTGGFVCRSKLCNAVVWENNLVSHLSRKHKINASTAKRVVENLTSSKPQKPPHPLSYRYKHDPYPKEGERPLPALSLLPVWDIVRCTLCAAYFKGTQSCKVHMRNSHVDKVNLQQKMLELEKQPIIKGQTLFTGSYKLYFPVSLFPSGESASTQLKSSILYGDVAGRNKSTDVSDSTSVVEKSSNLSAKVIGVPEFLEAHNFSLEKAYSLTTMVDKGLHAALVRMFVDYIQHFSKLSPAIPIPVVESIKIQDRKTTGSFSLSVEMTTKQRYSRIAARFLILSTKLDKATACSIGVHSAVCTTALKVLNLTERATYSSLLCLHSFCRELLLSVVRASEGETISLENMFKLVVAGFARVSEGAKVRVGDSEDASHTAAALQYFCHLSALGEFMLAPRGFGTRTEEEEEARLRRVQGMLTTKACSPAAYLRSILFKTKRISPGECHRVNFVVCDDHPFCGKVDNIEVPLNSDQSGSLGYTVRCIAQHVRKTLCETLMKNFGIPTDFVNVCISFPDRFNDKKPGYFFGSEGDAFKEFCSWGDDFARHLATCDTPVIQKVEDNGAGWMATDHAPSWLHAVDQLSEQLYILVHLCGGGPPRITEMIDARLRNTSGGKRNLFIMKKCLVLIGAYIKTSRQYEKPKPVARFLDDNTTELLLLFIVFIKPTQSFLLRKILGSAKSSDEYLFCHSGDKIDEKAMGRAFAKALSDTGLPLTVRLYRHYRTGSVKMFLRERIANTEEHVAFHQAGHSEITARMRYASTDFCFEELGTEQIEAFYHVSRWWHEMVGIMDTVASPNQKSQSKQPEAWNSGAPKQRIPERSFLPAVDAGLQNKPKGQLQVLEPKTSPSESWRQKRKSAHLCSSRETKRKIDRNASDDKCVSHLCEIVRNNDPMDSIMSSIRRILRCPSQEAIVFKSEAQRAAVIECAMQTIMKGYNSTMLVVLPTGGGKTLCWAAPALREQEINITAKKDPVTTLVVLPLVALQQDVLRKCRNSGISCATWDNRFDKNVTVVVCSVEAVMTNGYNRYISAMFAQNRIARIVVDEIHLVPQWKSFRKFSMLRWRVRPEGTETIPLLLLTATAPPEVAAEIQDYLAVDASCFKLYREVNSRPNISYCVEFVEHLTVDAMISHCARILDGNLRGLHNSERVIAYCLTIREAELLAEKLDSLKSSYGVRLYHGKMTTQQREESFKQWTDDLSTTPQAMIASPAFSCGIDFPHVRTVLHVGGARTLVELAQESGRAGRDGKPSTNVIVYNFNYMSQRLRSSCSDDSTSGKAKIFGDVSEFFNKGEKCRRQVLESFLNGMPRGPCTGGEMKCDICLDVEVESRMIMMTDTTNFQNHSRRLSITIPGRARVIAPHGSNAKKSETNRIISSTRGGTLVFGFDRRDAMWKARQITRLKCAVCLFAGLESLETISHKDCMRAKCYRCVEANAAHQSKACKVIPRGSKTNKRCFACGISENKDLHEPGTFNSLSACQWLVPKNLVLLSWRSDKHRSSLIRQVGGLRFCKNVGEVGAAICGAEEQNNRAILAEVVDWLYRVFVMKQD